MNRLKGDAWLLADALRQMRMFGEYRYKDLTTVEHVEAMLMFLTEFTGRKNLFEEGLLKYEQAQREGRKVAMVDLFGASYRAGVTDGRAEGVAEGITIGRNAELASSVNFMRELGVSQKDIDRYINSRSGGSLSNV